MQNKGKSEGYESEIKENVHGTNSDGKEMGTQISGLEWKKEINIQSEQNEEKECIKMRRGLGTSGTTLNVPNPKHRGGRRRGRARNGKLI